MFLLASLPLQSRKLKRNHSKTREELASLILRASDCAVLCSFIRPMCYFGVVGIIGLTPNQGREFQTKAWVGFPGQECDIVINGKQSSAVQSLG